MPDRITGRTRTIALMIVLLAAFMDLMDVTILNGDAADDRGQPARQPRRAGVDAVRLHTGADRGPDQRRTAG